MNMISQTTRAKKPLFLIVILALLPLLLVGYSIYSNSANDIVFKSTFAEVKLDGDNYAYSIFVGNKVLCEGTCFDIPSIIELDNSIVRLEQGDGTNNRKVQYIDLTTDQVSSTYAILSGYADTTEFYDKYYIAYPTYNELGDSVFRVEEIFGDKYQDFIPQGSVNPTGYDRIITFLNEEEVYVEYTTYDPSSQTRIKYKEVFSFGDI